MNMLHFIKITGARLALALAMLAGFSDTLQAQINLPAKIEAENYTAEFGVAHYPCNEDDGEYLGYLDVDDWMEYSVNAPAAGTYSVSFRLASKNNNTQLQLRKSDDTVLATVNVPNTGDWETWQTIIAPNVELDLGVQTLKVYVTAKYWNFNWMEISGPLAPTADILTFGIPGSPAVITGTSIAWTVPANTNLATLAPTFTLSAGASCNQPNGSAPTPNFSAGPVHYIVNSAAPVITQDYTVTVSKASFIPDYLKDDFNAVIRTKSTGANIFNATDNNYVNNVQDPGNVFVVPHPDTTNTGWHFERSTNENAEWIEYEAPTGHVFAGVSVRVLTNGLDESPDKDTCLTAFAGPNSAPSSPLSLTRAIDTSNGGSLGGSDNWVGYIFSSPSFAGQKYLRIYLNPLTSSSDTWRASVDTVTLSLVATGGGGGVSGFNDWTITKGLSAGDAAFDADPDHDGALNGIEFVIGGQPNPNNLDFNSALLMPKAVNDGTNLVFTFTRTDESAYLNPIVEFSTIMKDDSWTTAVHGVNATITESVIPPVNGSAAHSVTVTIPKNGALTLFARLKVVQTVP